MRVELIFVAEDYCVKCTALDAKKRQFETWIVEDCTKGVGSETIEAARNEFKSAGVEYIHSSEVRKRFQQADV